MDQLTRNAMNLTCFDAETAPLPDSQLSALEPEFLPPANYKNPDLIAANLAEQRQKWRERAALDPSTGQILAIGYVEPDGSTTISTGEPDETMMLVEFFARYEEEASKGGRMVGFAIHHFDLPFIVKRAWILGVPVPPALRPNGQSRFYWPTVFVDLQAIWQLGDTRTPLSLDNACKSLGIGQKNGSGADFARLYADPATRDQALDYLRNDIQLTAKLAERLLA